MIEKTKAPVLLIVFNRPDTTKLVFEAIKKAKPDKLYIAADAPRIGNIEDVKNCTYVKDIVQQVDWDCEVHRLYAEINQGCGPGPFNAISWVFEHEDRAIILEDDCIPALPFFDYCSELLERYKDDTRIWSISGNQYNEEAVNTTHSYFYSKYGHSWGWATWKRCWGYMDMEMSKFPLLIEQNLNKSIYRTREEADYFYKKFEINYSDKSHLKHIWDVQWGFALATNSHICIVPIKNLVKNIGYIGTHSENKTRFHDRPIDENYKIESHPDFILIDANYDAYHFKHHWQMQDKMNLYSRLKSIIRKIVNGLT